MCFGGGSDKESKEMIKIQKEEIAEAKRKEEERKANIEKGLASIKGFFEGKRPTQAVTKDYDWSQFKAPATSGAELAFGGSKEAQGVPEGYTYGTKKVTTAGKAGTKKAGKITSNPRGRGYIVTNSKGQPQQFATYGEASAAAQGMTGGTAGKTTTQKGFYDAEGNFHPEGSDFDVVTQEEYGDPVGGFDEGFYNKFKQGMLDFTQPEVAKQYGDAREELAYRLYRAGQGRSSTAAQETADLYEQNLNRTGEVMNAADKAAADLKTRVEKEKQALISQLYSTEDPSMAANNAISAVQNISAVPPDISPLGALFDLASIGGAGLAQGYSDSRFRSGKSWLPSDDASRNVA